MRAHLAWTCLGIFAGAWCPVGASYGTCQNGLVGYWRLNDQVGDVTPDASGQGNHGLIKGTPREISGVQGRALEFIGLGAHIDCGANAHFDIKDALTLSLWVKTYDAGLSQYRPFITKGNRSYGLRHHQSNSIEFYIHDGVSVSARWRLSSWSRREWHHLMGTFNGNCLVLYIDGQKAAETAHTGSIASSATALMIAANAESPDRFCDAVIDEVRVYNRVLDPNEGRLCLTPGYIPEHGQKDVPRSAVLRWPARAPHLQYDVYLGTDQNEILPSEASEPHSTLISQAQDTNSLELPEPLQFNQTYFWRVDAVNDGSITQRGDVRHFTTESMDVVTKAYAPQPVCGRINVDPFAQLTWRSGHEANIHEVYLGTDRATLDLIETTARHSTQTLSLAYAQTYFWRVDSSVTATDPPTQYQGDIWNFTTSGYCMIDDFESYDDNCNWIFATWQDGLGHYGGEDIPDCNLPPYEGNGTGSIVFHYYGRAFFIPRIVRIPARSGTRSLILDYDNAILDSGISETNTRDYALLRDWTKGGVNTLSLSFLGHPAPENGTDTSGLMDMGASGRRNDAEPFYIVILDGAGNSKRIVHPDADAVQSVSWQEWHIPLSKFSAAGLDLTDVKNVTIGVGHENAALSEASGLIFIDDIRLGKTVDDPAIRP